MRQQAQIRERRSLLGSYTGQLGLLIERHQHEAALVEAKRAAEKAAALARRAMVEAQAADRAKTKFLANMSHELRTPLNAIMGFSEMLRLGDELGRNRHAEYAGYIHDSAQHLLGIVSDILDLARIEAGKLDLEERTDTLDRLVRSALQTIKPLAGQKQINLSTTIEPGDLLLYVDQTKFRQILLNLLSNAVKFTPEGGNIDTRAGLDEAGRLVVSVTDSGIGIPAGSLARVLEPFEQIEGHLTRKSPGAGLGLPIARSLARAHGGELVLRSTVGVGTTVEVQLPAERVRRLAAFGPE
jgi:signal transduction histidine kinase